MTTRLKRTFLGLTLSGQTSVALLSCRVFDLRIILLEAQIARGTYLDGLAHNKLSALALQSYVSTMYEVKEVGLVFGEVTAIRARPRWPV